MKILIVHNAYGSYAGEEAAADNMCQMLERMGHSVVRLERTTRHIRDSIWGKVRVFGAAFGFHAGRIIMRKALRKHRPDVVIVHNLYPFITPSSLKECRRAGVPVVMAIHNFRLICPTGLFLRNSQPCEYCLVKGNEWGCVKYNCENSFFKSLAYAVRSSVARIRKQFVDNVTRYVALNEFQRSKLIVAGFPPEKIIVIPNSVPYSTVKLNRGSYVAYCGRISNEKGIDIIMETARRNRDITFKLAGGIREKELVEHLPNNIELLGHLKGEELKDFYSGSRFCILASRCYESFPMSILEAGIAAKAVIAPDHGGLTRIVGDDGLAGGRLFKPGDVEDFSSKVRELWDNPQLCERLGRNAYDRAVRYFSSDAVSEKWASLLAELN